MTRRASVVGVLPSPSLVERLTEEALFIHLHKILVSVTDAHTGHYH